MSKISIFFVFLDGKNGPTNLEIFSYLFDTKIAIHSANFQTISSAVLSMFSEKI